MTEELDSKQTDITDAQATLMRLMLDRTEAGLSHCAIERDLIVAYMEQRGIKKVSPVIDSLESRGYLKLETFRITRLIDVDSIAVWATADGEDIDFLFVTEAGASWGRRRDEVNTGTEGRISP